MTKTVNPIGIVVNQRLCKRTRLRFTSAFTPTFDVQFSPGVDDPRFTNTRAGNATRVNSSGLLETVSANVWRDNYNPSTLVWEGKLVEYQSINLNPNNSTPLTSGGGTYTLQNLTRTLNSSTSPDGTSNASLLTDDAVNGRHDIECRTLANQPVGSYSRSVWVKNQSAGFAAVRIQGDAGLTFSTAVIDLSSGAITSTATLGTTLPNIVSQYINGWWRVSLGITIATATNFVFIEVGPCNTGTPAYDGVGRPTYAGTGQSIYAYGDQMEAGTSSTSYIPTAGSTVTRAADIITVSGIAPLVNLSQGTLFVKGIAKSNFNTSGSILGLNDGTNNNRIQLRRQTTNNNSNYRFVGNSVSGADIAGANNGFPLNTLAKLAMTYSATDQITYYDGAQVAAFGAGATPFTSITQMQLGDSVSSEKIAFAYQRLFYNNTPLSASQIAGL